MILDEIVRAKRVALPAAKAAAPVSELQQRPLFRAPRRSFIGALQVQRRAIIAEVKKASPSKGVICPDFDPVAIASSYARGGAAAISVLTEEHYFLGHLDYLAAIRAAVDIPLLRKDFVFDPYQLYEARAYGADAALLIVAILSAAELHDLQWLCEELGLAALVEVHDRGELDRAITSGATLIGINNRDLRTFEVSLNTTESLMSVMPKNATVVSESGIDSTADMQRLEQCGVRAFLVGESLMRAADPGTKLAQLLK